jgi:aminoglycoside phosphotransferase (APT) family kinase protein
MKLDRVIAVRTSKTVYRDGDRAIKVFDSGYSKADILNEALNQARVEETALHVPKLLEVTTVDGCWAIVSEYVKGKTLAQLMAENPEQLDEYLNLFVDIQMDVHEQKAPLLNKLRDKMDRKISQTTLDATTRYDLHTRLEGMPKREAVCHGDFNPTNIVIAEDGTPYILDWAHAAQGNAAADAAQTYLLFWMDGQISTADKYLDLFCKKSDTPKQYVQKWMSIVAAAQSASCQPEEREFLLSWVDVVDYQ